MHTPGRRQVLRSRSPGLPQPLRPPWALPGAQFIHVCTRCDACIGACPQRILARGSGGFPEVRFDAGGCTFCGECARACAAGAIARGGEAASERWLLTAAIGPACLAAAGVVCRSCGEVCEAGAIRFRLAAGRAPRPELDREACSGCGFCVSVCPAGAIAMIEQPAALAAPAEA